VFLKKSPSKLPLNRDGNGSGLSPVEQLPVCEEKATGRNSYTYTYPRVEFHTRTCTRLVLDGYRVPVGYDN
jgi:hypothetical protein